MQRLTSNPEKEAIDPTIYTIEIAEPKSTLDLLAQMLEKLSTRYQHFANLTAKASHQEERLAVMCAKANQQHESLVALSVSTKEHFSALTA